MRFAPTGRWGGFSESRNRCSRLAPKPSGLGRRSSDYVNFSETSAKTWNTKETGNA